MTEPSLPPTADPIQSEDLAEYCGKMCRELGVLARLHRLDLLAYLLLLAENEAKQQQGGCSLENDNGCEDDLPENTPVN